MRDRELWKRVFLGGLVGGALYVRSKAEADELVQRAKMIADKAASVAAREFLEDKADASAALAFGEYPPEESFPLVRRSPPTPPAWPHVEPLF